MGFILSVSRQTTAFRVHFRSRVEVVENCAGAPFATEEEAEKQTQLSPHRHRKSCNSPDGRPTQSEYKEPGKLQDFPVNTLNSMLGLGLVGVG